MNRALPEMMHFRNQLGNNNGAGNGTEITVLERQRDRKRWHQEQVLTVNANGNLQGGEEYGHDGYFGGDNECSNMFSTMPIQFQSLIKGDSDSVLDHVLYRVLKPDPDLENGWQDHGKIPVGARTGGIGFHDENLGFETCGGYANGARISMNYGLSRTTSCLPENLSATGNEKSGRESGLPEKLSPAAGRESFKKRKADKIHKVAGDDRKDKKLKICAEEGDSKITEQTNSKNKETSTDTSKENSKVSVVPKQDYIHVRARRGQATDSHSLTERVRREKISERMKYLQDLVPGCNRITGKAGMLDEIINYVQSLQRQVEFLSMKLATVNPRFDISIENLFVKEVYPACTSGYQTTGVSSKMVNPIPTGMQFNPLQQLMSTCDQMEMGTNLSDLELLCRTTSATPLTTPETFVDALYFPQIQPSSVWDAELQNIYNLEFQQAGRSTSFLSQQFTGSIEANNLRMEM